jgi:hypothetical protein
MSSQTIQELIYLPHLNANFKQKTKKKDDASVGKKFIYKLSVF